jgi:hypothetical protein
MVIPRYDKCVLAFQNLLHASSGQTEEMHSPETLVHIYQTMRSQISKFTAKRISNITFNPLFLTLQPVYPSVNSWFMLMIIRVRVMKAT